MNDSQVNRIYGVDFSGAKYAGSKIWIASATPTEDGVFVEGCFPAKNLPGGGRERCQALEALQQFIEGKPHAAFGLDFPFSLPKDVIPAEMDWEGFVKAFPELYDGPLDLHEQAKDRGDQVLEDGVEIRRETDLTAKAPFCPYNWRMKHQTYHGISGLLHPLIARNAASVIPMLAPDESKPLVLEVCPSSTLRELELPRTSYKGRYQSEEQVRGEILTGLIDLGVVIPRHTKQMAQAESEGDAVDAIVAALATYRALNGRFDQIDGGVEGHIYV